MNAIFLPITCSCISVLAALTDGNNTAAQCYPVLFIYARFKRFQVLNSKLWYEFNIYMLAITISPKPEQLTNVAPLIKRSRS